MIGADPYKLPARVVFRALRTAVSALRGYFLPSVFRDRGEIFCVSVHIRTLSPDHAVLLYVPAGTYLISLTSTEPDLTSKNGLPTLTPTVPYPVAVERKPR